MATLVIAGHLCKAGDGYECSYLLLDGEILDRLLEPHGRKIPNVVVKRLPGAKEDTDVWTDHLQHDYGKVRIVVDFLDKASG